MTHRQVATDPDRKWAVEVGRFMLAFGDIEHTAIACLCAIPADAFGKVTASMSLGVRLDLLAAILEGKDSPDYRKLAGLVGEIKRFLDNRNLVAHNPVQFSFYMNKGLHDIRIQTELVSTRNRNKRLTFNELRDLADQAERLAHGFGEAAMEVLREHHWEKVHGEDW